MKLNIVIPITGDQTEKFEDIKRYLKPHLSQSTSLHFDNIQWGFPSVETELQGMFNGTEIVRHVMRDKGTHYDGVFVDCFDDPGVYACRELGIVPVIGPYQTAMASAQTIAERIGIITTDESGRLNEERKAKAMGFADSLVSIRALDMEVSDIRNNPQKVLTRLIELCRNMVERDRVHAICLGCTAMFYIADELKKMLLAEHLNVNIIEPILNGVLTLENIVRMGYNNYVEIEADLSHLEWPIW